ncbi:MAG: Nramp family divalent metal transporter, partial [Planctomycetaceae bacterium]|nr:Nramp family divalent metal transporter [Planctomycetaceae bacterium]
MAVHEAPPTSPELAGFTPPHPGSPLMPRWTGGELPAPPVFSWKKIAAFVGPGLVAGASAIGAGEWLNGPMVCARYGGALLWLATISILGQIVYNMEVSRYTLYTGESIFTGKFRTLPGPLFWLGIYLVLDFGTLFPYLAAQAGTPIFCIFAGHMPDPSNAADKRWLEWISYGVFLGAIVPLIFGGKVYNSIRVLMTFKIFLVLGFLTILAIFYSKPSTWAEIGSGFLKFGTVPVMKGEDSNGNGVLDPGEDWDGDGRLDGVEERVDKNGNKDPHDFGEYVDADGDGRYDGYKAENIFVSWWEGKPLPELDLSMIAILGAMAALAGNGGLTNTNVSGYTRDQGWGMGKHVGAIPSVVGGHSVKLSHVGMVFPIT